MSLKLWNPQGGFQDQNLYTQHLISLTKNIVSAICPNRQKVQEFKSRVMSLPANNNQIWTRLYRDTGTTTHLTLHCVVVWQHASSPSYVMLHDMLHQGFDVFLPDEVNKLQHTCMHMQSIKRHHKLDTLTRTHIDKNAPWASITILP